MQLAALLADICGDGDDQWMLVSHIDPRELGVSELLHDGCNKRRFDLLLVALSVAPDVEALLSAPDLPLDTVVVAVSADRSLRPEEVMGEAGCAGLLHAPVSLPSLRHTLHKLLPRSSACAQLALPPPIAAGRPSARVLQVEPCEVTANATQLLFAELGLYMDTAADGAAARRLLGRRPYDLVIVELDLPCGMSGCALASWYKQRCKAAARAAAPVVVLTAEESVADPEAFGVDDWLQRPLSTPQMASLLGEWLRGQRGGATPPGRSPPRAAPPPLPHASSR